MSVAERLFGFQGRIRRRDWWLLVLGIVVIETTLSLGALYALSGPSAPWFGPESIFLRPDPKGFAVFAAEIQALFLPTLIAITVQRRHDCGVRGWFAALVQLAIYADARLRDIHWFGLPHVFGPGLELLSAVGSLWLLFVLGVEPGTPGPNQFGPSPKPDRMSAAAEVA
jgi:uncharacterized membrane protein YhaH (DUF805 family)